MYFEVPVHTWTPNAHALRCKSNIGLTFNNFWGVSNPGGVIYKWPQSLFNISAETYSLVSLILKI